jgi:hypothetical protein
MPERPDFDRIAQRLAMTLPGAIGAPYVLLGERIAQELRLAWNARGVADLAIVHAKLSTPDRPDPRMKGLTRALRTLDM